jgi:hypothetical protein
MEGGYDGCIALVIYTLCLVIKIFKNILRGFKSGEKGAWWVA